jgi:RNA polymerase sigma-70 factor (ECF subfamily)
MSDPSLDTAELHSWLDQIGAGDPHALDKLLRRVSGRLESLTRKMLRRFPRVARWSEAEDILQNATLRLIRALRDVRPRSMREFFALASTQVRRELLDVTKQLYGPHGDAANHASVNPDDSAAGRLLDPAVKDDERELDKWCLFHQEVEKLPAEEREVVGLIFYHAWKQEQVAELFGVTVRTVQRWWRSALAQLQNVLSDWPIKD